MLTTFWMFCPVACALAIVFVNHGVFSSYLLSVLIIVTAGVAGLFP